MALGGTAGSDCRMDHGSPAMPMVINWVLAVYLAGSIWSIMSFCQMLWRYVPCKKKEVQEWFVLGCFRTLFV